MLNDDTSHKPQPNINKEYLVDVVPCGEGKISLYELTSYLSPYSSRDRDNYMKNVKFELHGKTASFYIIDTYDMLTRPQAIILARKFIDGDYDKH